MPDEHEFIELVWAINDREQAAVLRMLGAIPQLATMHCRTGATRENAREFYFGGIEQYLYAGDTALHMAAAAYQTGTVRALLAAGADVSAKNRRGAEPLHYAADGGPGSSNWRPEAQAATIRLLIEGGADPNAADKSGVAPLHRAVRGRCAEAVRALLAGGADAGLANKSGSTPMKLALLDTGRGGSGSEEARAQQALIIELLNAQGVRT